MALPLLRSRLVALAASAALLGAGCGLSDEELPELPVLYELQPFTLVDQTGQPFGLEQLRGRVWVVDFFFTRCPSICSELTRRMQSLADEWKKNKSVGFLSITVDPDHDTPEVLEAYHRRWRGGDAWVLCTGEPEAVRTVSFEQFKVAFEGNLERDGDITHSSRFILVDADGRIRGYPSIEDASFQTEVHRGVRKMLLELEEPGPDPAPAD